MYFLSFHMGVQKVSLIKGFHRLTAIGTIEDKHMFIKTRFCVNF